MDVKHWEQWRLASWHHWHAERHNPLGRATLLHNDRTFCESIKKHRPTDAVRNAEND